MQKWDVFAIFAMFVHEFTEFLVITASYFVKVILFTLFIIVDAYQAIRSKHITKKCTFPKIKLQSYLKYMATDLQNRVFFTNSL